MSIVSHILCLRTQSPQSPLLQFHILYQGDHHAVLGLPSIGCGSEVPSCRKLRDSKPRLTCPFSQRSQACTAFWSANSCFIYFVQFSSHLYHERKFSSSYAIIAEDGISLRLFFRSLAMLFLYASCILNSRFLYKTPRYSNNNISGFWRYNKKMETRDSYSYARYINL